jgi:ABC-type dipeptide/oligopeptide/nickel transport system ATPase component
MADAPLLGVHNLTTVFDLPDGPANAVEDVSFDVQAGETLCLVGESGSGKSMTAYSILRLVPPPGRIGAGSVIFRNRELLELSDAEMQRIRGAEIGLVFQEPMSALDPVFTIGQQIAEVLVVHGRARAGREARGAAVDLLRRVGLPDPHQRVDDYAHQLSGGMRQRATIAIAIACSPALLIADEPTTALDVTLQAQVLDLLKAMRDTLGLALLLITHDFGVVAHAADRVAVMQRGRLVELAPVRELFHRPVHPYTRALLSAVPGGGTRTTAVE